MGKHLGADLMALLLLSATNHPDTEQVYSLDGANYVFRFRYNERAGAWFLDVATEDGTTLVTGRKVVVSWIIAGLRETSASMMPGHVFALDTSATDTDPTLDDLGTRVAIYYLESSGWE